jgi:hypothetical protein
MFLLVLALRDLLKSRSLSVFNPERWLKCATGTALRLLLQDGPGQDAASINALYAETSSQLDPTLLSESKIIRAYRYFKTELESHLDTEDFDRFPGPHLRQGRSTFAERRKRRSAGRDF